MFQLYDKEFGTSLGSLNEAQADFLHYHADQDAEGESGLRLTPAVLDRLESEGADHRLLSLLRRSLGEREAVILEWVRT